MKAKLDKQQKFIALRVEGNSFDAIAKKIKVSKPTLIKWNKEQKDKILEVTKIYEEQFIAEQRIKRITRAKSISDELDEAYKALSKTDYTKMNKKELINIIERLEQKLEKVTGFDTKLSEAVKNRIVDEYLEENEQVEPPQLGVPRDY